MPPSEKAVSVPLSRTSTWVNGLYATYELSVGNRSLGFSNKTFTGILVRSCSRHRRLMMCLTFRLNSGKRALCAMQDLFELATLASPGEKKEVVTPKVYVVLLFNPKNDLTALYFTCFLKLSSP